VKESYSLVIEVKIANKNLKSDIEFLFSSNSSIDNCSCMWFLISVKDYHAGGREQNRLRFYELLQAEIMPVGLIAYHEENPVGWCAVGPRSRYHRAIRTPTYKGRAPDEDTLVWLTPCFFVRDEARALGVAEALLERAITLAEESGATAIEGFPFSGNQRRYSGDTQVGIESVFTACGFSVIRRPSENRVIMRRELK
jgi:GNAT superfamily N-acetyltransferase